MVTQNNKEKTPPNTHTRTRAPSGRWQTIPWCCKPWATRVLRLVMNWTTGKICRRCSVACGWWKWCDWPGWLWYGGTRVPWEVFWFGTWKGQKSFMQLSWCGHKSLHPCSQKTPYCNVSMWGIRSHVSQDRVLNLMKPRFEASGCEPLGWAERAEVGCSKIAAKTPNQFGFKDVHVLSLTGLTRLDTWKTKIVWCFFDEMARACWWV